jgi:hypothetical protein
MLAVVMAVVGENLRKLWKTKIIKKYRKSFILADLRYFLVEISGIEPLTS